MSIPSTVPGTLQMHLSVVNFEIGVRVPANGQTLSNERAAYLLFRPVESCLLAGPSRGIVADLDCRKSTHAHLLMGWL
jgi:hypothetical protein